MSRQGLDVSSGAFWLDESVPPIQPSMRLDDFLEKFSSVGAYRDPAQLKLRQQLPDWPPPPPICHFKKTHRILGSDLSISLQFSKHEPPTLDSIRMFLRPKPWSGKISLAAKLRRAVTGNILSGLPKGFSSKDRERDTYEQWLLEATGKTEHQQVYDWGELMLVHYRDEDYLFQINYSK